MVDRRICIVETADVFASYKRYYPLFTVRGCNKAFAIYVFGKRVYAKGWEQS